MKDQRFNMIAYTVVLIVHYEYTNNFSVLLALVDAD